MQEKKRKLCFDKNKQGACIISPNPARILAQAHQGISGFHIQKGDFIMNTTKHTAMSGKGFYVALSLCVAMVGAACWYAYTETGTPKKPSVSENSVSDGMEGTSVTTTGATTTTTQTESSGHSVAGTMSSGISGTVTTAEKDVLAVFPPKTTTTETTVVTAQTTAPAERPVYPIAGDILQSFSNGELVKSPTTGVWQTHNGVDFAAAAGTEVCCIADGTVTSVERDPLWGVCVTILHADGTVSRYCGLNEGLTVSAGEVLERGKVIGAVGDTADAESALESHLHFELLQNERYVDPIAYLEKKN